MPVRTPKPAATVKYIREQLARSQVPPTLTTALSRQRVTDVRAELEAIASELYDVLARHRRGIKLLDRSARDYPELAALWFQGARGGLVGLLANYIEDRTRRKLLKPVPDALVAARLLIETTVFWAVHRHFDSRPEIVSEELARETVAHFVVRAFRKE